MSSIGIVTFDNPTYLISGLGPEFFVYVSLIRLGGPDELVLLSSTRFTPVQGLCNGIEVVPALLPPPKTQFYGPSSRVTVPSDGWGIVQIKGNSVTLSLSDAGQDIVIHFVPANAPADFADPADGLAAPGPDDLPPDGQVFVNGGSIWNGIENSLVSFFYTTNGKDVIRSPVLPFGQGSGVLEQATISRFFIRQPPTANPIPYWTIDNVKEEEGMSAVVMQRPIVPPAPGGIPGAPEYLLASMVEEGPIPMADLTDILVKTVAQ